MMDAATQALLQKVLRRQSLSLLQYVREAFPWIRSGEDKALAELRQVIGGDRQALAALGQFLVRRRVALPYIGQFPVDYTSINFVALDYLLPMLVRAERQETANLEGDLSAIADPEAREQLRKLLDLKRRHLSVLERLAAAHTEAVVRT